MSLREIREYYDLTGDSETREDLVYAASITDEPKIAIDCGCGAGSDIAYLSELGFTVHAFDIEEESISRCRKRFEGVDNIYLSQNSFQSFDFFRASLIVADASLFFCAESEFDAVWLNMNDSLISGGIFCGSFLGPEATMATPECDPQKFWPDRLVLNEYQVKERFVNYHVHRFNEHKVSGATPQGDAHDWHIYSVVVEKN
jgi:SAM-dependent methyltransferase